MLFEDGLVAYHIAGTFAFGLCAALAMSAGIGGGGLFVPLIMVLLEKDAKQATSMSQCLIAGGAIAGLIYNSNQRHPSKNRPLISLSVVTFLAPLQMGGALVGNILNQMLPKYLIVMLLIVVLSFSVIKSMRKGMQLYQKEKSSMQPAFSGVPVAEEEEFVEEVETYCVSGKEGVETCINKSETECEEVTTSEGPTFGGAPLLDVVCPGTKGDTTCGDPDNSEAGFNMCHVGMLICVWLITLLLIFARGGKGADSVFGIAPCSGAYWGVTATAVLGLIAFAVFTSTLLMGDTATKIETGYDFAEGDMLWEPALCLKLGVTTIIAGVMAGLVGIGGGMVLGPVLLDTGFIPEVSSALTATNVLLSSSTVSMLVLISGIAPIDESMFFFGCCLVGAFFGKFYLGKVIRRLGRTSLIVFTLVLVISLSIFAVAIQGISEWLVHGFVGGFSGVCD